MISIIICSRKADISEELKQNIAETIGCEHEICVIDNSRNDYTIFTAYNEGVRRAKGDVLCFMHEDIVFHSQDWGKAVSKALEDKTIGCVGIIGSWFLPKVDTSWWFCNANVGSILQGDVDRKGNYRTFVEGAKPQQNVTDVVVVDGCWYCIPKAMFDAIRYDDETYNSFHCYDIDICMQVLKAGKRVVVCSDIELEHKSGGNVTDTYFEQLSLFFRKWRDYLPINKGMELTPEVEQWVSEIIHSSHMAAQRNVMLKNTRRYKLVDRIRDWFKK